MLIMPFLSGILRKKYTWIYHQILMNLEDMGKFTRSKNLFKGSNNHPKHGLIGLLKQFNNKVMIRLKQIIHYFLDNKTTIHIVYFDN